jgi:hypothetical protein
MKKAKLPKQFADNLEQIATGLHGRPINLDYAAEWKISHVNAVLLLEYMYKTGVIEITWLPEKQQMCFIKKSRTIN